MICDRRAGFTFVEIVVTMAVMGVLTAIAIPTYHYWISRSRVDGAARELLTDLQAARMKAISENNNYVVTFDTGNDSYSIYDDDDNDGPESGELIKTVNIAERYPGTGYGYVPGDNPSGNPITQEVTFTGTPPKVSFKPTGLAKNGSVYLMPTEDVATQRKDRQRAVTVLISGRVRLYRHTGSIWE